MDEQIIDTLKQGEKDLKTDIETLKKHIYDVSQTYFSVYPEKDT